MMFYFIFFLLEVPSFVAKLAKIFELLYSRYCSYERKIIFIAVALIKVIMLNPDLMTFLFNSCLKSYIYIRIRIRTSKGSGSGRPKNIGYVF
jgi:hypothetical protein